MFNPDISVIVPTYNRAQWVCRCIEAILAQDYRNFELIVVDDGSQDDTLAKIKKYQHEPTSLPLPCGHGLTGARQIVQAQGPRVSIVHQTNRGVSSARNKGISLAQCEYITFCDSDDVWQPNKLSVERQFFRDNPSAIVCYSDEIWIRHGSRVNPCKHHAKMSGNIFEKSLELCIVSPSSVMMHRSFFDLVGKFDEDLPACEDYDLWLRAAITIPFCYIPQPLIIKYGGHDDQLSKKYWGMDRFRVQALVKCLKTANLTPQQRQQAINMLIKKCNVLIQGARKRGNFIIANQFEQLREQWLIEIAPS